MNEQPKLGELLPADEFRRDAIHLAIAPVTAAHTLQPGQHVGFREPGNTDLVGVSDTPVGIVDPFLTRAVVKGQRFFLCLYPGSVTSLRHIWTSEAFTVARKEPS